MAFERKFWHKKLVAYATCQNVSKKRQSHSDLILYDPFISLPHIEGHFKRFFWRQPLYHVKECISWYLVVGEFLSVSLIYHEIWLISRLLLCVPEAVQFARYFLKNNVKKFFLFFTISGLFSILQICVPIIGLILEGCNLGAHRRGRQLQKGQNGGWHLKRLLQMLKY